MSAAENRAATQRRAPRCSSCKSRALTVVEHHHGVGMWGSDEWELTPEGDLHLFGRGYSDSSPMPGRIEFECEDCGHTWKIRGRSLLPHMAGDGAVGG